MAIYIAHRTYLDQDKTFPYKPDTETRHWSISCSFLVDKLCKFSDQNSYRNPFCSCRNLPEEHLYLYMKDIEIYLFLHMFCKKCNKFHKNEFSLTSSIRKRTVNSFKSMLLSLCIYNNCMILVPYIH